MPPKPFPLPINIGIDLCFTPRIRAIITKGRLEAGTSSLFLYLRHYLTSREIKIFLRRYGPVQDALSEPRLASMSNYLAGRWAAKEATIKAFKHRRLTFKHIQILQRADNSVYALVLNKPASSLLPQPPPSSNDTLNSADSTSASQVQKGTGTSCNDHESTEASPPSRLVTPEDQDNASPPSEPNDDFIPSYMQDDDLPGQIAQISISHDGEYATAVCLAAEEPRPGDVGGEAAAREP